MQLPTGAELLLAKVSGLAITPVSKDSLLSFDLPKPTDELSRVLFSYTMKLEPLDPVSGSLALALPLVDLFIDHLDWTLTLPDAYDIEAIDGNVERGSDQELSEGLMHLVKDLCRNERPSIELYYRRQELSQ